MAKTSYKRYINHNTYTSWSAAKRSANNIRKEGYRAKIMKFYVAKTPHYAVYRSIKRAKDM